MAMAHGTVWRGHEDQTWRGDRHEEETHMVWRLAKPVPLLIMSQNLVRTVAMPYLPHIDHHESGRALF